MAELRKINTNLGLYLFDNVINSVLSLKRKKDSLNFYRDFLELFIAHDSKAFIKTLHSETDYIKIMLTYFL
jgi:hypothetical protein